MENPVAAPEVLKRKIEELHSKYRTLGDGQLAAYIPELANVNPDLFAIAITLADGQTVAVGDVAAEFTLQSASKPFVYGLALATLGREKLHEKVGVEPSGEAFNSIVELEKVTHRPYNPMINSGAIAVTSLLPPADPTKRMQVIQDHFDRLAGRKLSIDQAVFESEKQTAHRNRSIAHLMRHFDVIDGDIEASLDLYFKQCSIRTNVKDLAHMAATLATGGVQPVTKDRVLKPETVRDVLSLMFTCGMYDSAGEWAFDVGMPAKSGVSGCLMAVAPGQMAIAVYSPLIDTRGHSCRGVAVIKELSEALGLGIFAGIKS